MDVISLQKIEEELKKTHKPAIYEGLPLPLNELTDRSFEILLYHIYRERLLRKDEEIVTMCDTVSLMQGVGEQGRDIMFSRNGAITGVVQCKKYKNNLSSRDVGAEILKFVMNYLNDDSLIGDLDDFTYYFAVSTGFSGATIGHFNDFGTYLCNEPQLEQWFKEIVKKYPAKFKGWIYSKKGSAVKNVLGKIKIRKIIPQDIEYKLSEFAYLYEYLFKIQSVTDNSLMETIINKYLKPILNKLDIQDLDKPDYTNRFREYLTESFNNYSTAKTLVFGNQQKKLEDFYYPLKVIKKILGGSGKLKEVLLLDEYKSDFIPKYKKVIVLDDGGMGKSTIFKWLFLSCIKTNKGIPVYIELRNLNKDNDLLDEITNKLNPLDFVIERKATAKILSQKGFVFFFDGYDEIKFENREFVTKDLQNFISKCTNSYFAISSRPEKALLAFSEFQEFGIQKLNKEDAFELIKKLDNYGERSLRLIEQIEQKGLQEMHEFLSNPLLVSLLFKKFEFRESIPFKKQEFFYEVFEALFQAHDLSKGGSFIREKESKLSLSEFFQILRGIGFRCIQDGIQFNEAQLLQIVNIVKKEFAILFDSYLFLNDLIKAVPLFVRDGLMVRWAHKSIQQYFAAEYICRDSKENQQKILMALYKSAQAYSYESILRLCYEIDYKSFRSSIIYSFCKETINNTENAFHNLKKAGKISSIELDIRKGLLGTQKMALIYGANNLVEKNKKKLYKEWGEVQEIYLPFNYVVLSNLGIFAFSIKHLLCVVNDKLVDSRNQIWPGDNILVNGLPKDFNMKQGELFLLDNDDPAHFLNTPKNFKVLNELLLSLYILIDVEKVKQTYVQINNEKENFINDDFISGF
ncbi:hypothetical protein A4D02_15805 [Niastella koreensis]|nr:hypothetical protein [Niastella koreensis]OQP40379.1 hypothetical protein A4D02_15805 [Niastella koreensis]